MHEQLYPDVYRIPVPLVGPLKTLNAYLVLDARRPLLIDSGFNMPESYVALKSALDELSVSPADLDFFITHRHADHAGLVPRLASPRARIYASRSDGEQINEVAAGMLFWKAYLPKVLPSGMPQALLDELLENHPGIRYAPAAMTYNFVGEGDILRYGGMSLRVMAFPGHSPGLLCLYEEKRRILFSSDHILGDITPNIARPLDGANPLGDYLASLQKADGLAMDQALPGHRSMVTDPHGRIRALQLHHEARMQEIREILGSRSLNPLETAAAMTWSMRGLSWENFPCQMVHFACGEAHAHLEHMRTTGELERSVRDKVLYYHKR